MRAANRTDDPVAPGFRGAVVAYGVLAVLVVAVVAANLAFGRGSLDDAALRDTLLALRGQRVAVAFLAGAGLAVAGVVVQGLFRNPLASPSILGTTSGAAFGGQTALLTVTLLFGAEGIRGLSPEMVLPLGCLVGALLALGILLTLLHAQSDRVALLLAGFLLSSLFVSLGSFVTSLAQQRWELGRAVVAFTLGGVSGSGPRHVALAVPLILSGTVAAWLWSRPLDLLLSGEDEAASLGVDVPLVRRWCVAWAAVLTAGAVAVGGGIGFVGLVVPHALRPFVGVEHRRLLPAAFLGGGLFVAAADLVVRLLPGVSEVPLGVVTGLVGAPLFLTLLLRSRYGGDD